MGNLKSPVLLAKIGAPHGVHGQLRVKSYTQDPLAIGNYGPLTCKEGRTFTVIKARPAKNVLVVSFKEIKSREDAQKAHDTELFITRERLPQNIDDDDFYIDDLIGMEVINLQCEILGKVLAISNFGAGDLLEISPAMENGRFGSNTQFIAFTKKNVPHIDLKNRRMTIIKPDQISERDIDIDDEQSQKSRQIIKTT